MYVKQDYNTELKAASSDGLGASVPLALTSGSSSDGRQAQLRNQRAV